MPDQPADPARAFYGRILVPVAWLCYGLGISPAFYGWGFLLPEMMADLGLSRQAGGHVFGLFNFVYGAIGPLTGLAMVRLGVRPVMATGAAITALGLLATSRIQSPPAAFLSFSLVTGLGVGLSTLVPATVLAANWFVRYRATITALIFTAGGLVGAVWPAVLRHALAIGGWRAGWILAATVAAVASVTAAVLVRDRPEDVAQFPDGAPGPPRAPQVDLASGGALWSAPFAILTLCAVASSSPWVVVTTHGPLHLSDLGVSTLAAAGLLGLMAATSVAGRLLGAAGDRFPPERVLAAGLLCEALGLGILMTATGERVLGTAVVLLGIGFGAAYINVSVLLGNHFGRRALPATAGVRFLVSACFTAVAPGLAGAVHDRTDSYLPAFAGLAVLCVVAAGLALRLRGPDTL